MSATHLKSFDLVGKKEDVSDFISLITPTDTPFISSIGTDKIQNTLFQWQEDQLRAVSKNAKVEGHDGTDSNRDQPAMRSNGTQTLSETYKISATSDAVKTYGRDKASAREAMKTGKLLKMDLEHSAIGTAQTYVAATESVAGEFAGVQAQISSATTLENAGVGRALSEALVVSAHEALYNEGSDATTLMIKPSDSKVVASWLQASGRTLNTENGEKKITSVVNVYESPFGTVRVVKNRRIRAADAVMYDPSNWKRSILRDWTREKLAKTGDAERYFMVGEFSLKHLNQKASALITDLL